MAKFQTVQEAQKFAQEMAQKFPGIIFETTSLGEQYPGTTPWIGLFDHNIGRCVATVDSRESFVQLLNVAQKLTHAVADMQQSAWEASHNQQSEEVDSEDDPNEKRIYMCGICRQTFSLSDNDYQAQYEQSPFASCGHAWKMLALQSHLIDPANYGAVSDQEWSEESEKEYQEQVHQGHSFTDQNGLTVQEGGIYGIDEQGNLYDIEPLNRFRPSEY